MVGSRAGQRSPMRLVPTPRACACVCVWVSSGLGWRFASPKSKVNPVSDVFLRQPYVIHEEELGFVGRKKKKATSKLTAFKQDISSKRIPEIPLSWNEPVAAQPSAAQGAPTLGRATYRWICARCSRPGPAPLLSGDGWELAFSLAVFLMDSSYFCAPSSTEEEGRIRVLEGSFFSLPGLLSKLQERQLRACRCRLTHQSNRSWWGWWA